MGGRWIFGYGSLVWRPSFPFAERHPAFVSGWGRRFWQGSTDHRGVPGRPGRVVTLVSDPGAACWGMAYRVAEEDEALVLARLDHREKGGYERHEVTLNLEGARESVESGSARAVDGLVYVATDRNPNYLGPAPLDAVVREVLASEGPSGHNVEYVLRLATALREIRPDLDESSEEALALASRVELALAGP